MENNNVQKEEVINIRTLPEVKQFNIHSIAYLTFLECKDISLGAKLVWLHLDARAGINRFLWFGKEKLYNTIGMSKNTYAKYTKELEEIGGIIRIKRFDKKHGERQTDIFIVCEFNQVEKKFITPPNIDEVNKGLKIKFKDSVLMFDDKEIIENKPKDKNCAKVKNPKDMNLHPKAKICAKAMNKFYLLARDKKSAEAKDKNCAYNKRKSFNKLKIYNKRKKENKRKDSPSILSDSIPDINIKEVINIIDIYFKTNIPEVGYNAYIKDNVKKAYLENDILIIPVENEFTKNLFTARYLEKCKKAFKGEVKLIVK